MRQGRCGASRMRSGLRPPPERRLRTGGTPPATGLSLRVSLKPVLPGVETELGASDSGEVAMDIEPAFVPHDKLAEAVVVRDICYQVSCPATGGGVSDLLYKRLR